ncbi:9002_t:CDS:2, partial [Ambispora leptoticha]
MGNFVSSEFDNFSSSGSLGSSATYSSTQFQRRSGSATYNRTPLQRRGSATLRRSLISTQFPQTVSSATNSSSNNQNKTKECAVCCEDIVASDFLQITSGCKHPVTVCRGCVNRHVESHLTNKGSVIITCPTLGCTQQLEHHDVKRLTESEVFKRYDTFSLREALRAMPEFRWCKNARCGSGQIHYQQ